MNKLLNVKTIGAIAVTFVLLSGFYIYIKNRSGEAVVLVPVNRGSDTQQVPLDNSRIPIAPPHRQYNHDVDREPFNNVGPPPLVIEEAEDDDLENPVPDGAENEDLVAQLEDKKMKGSVNYDLWQNVVGYFVDDVRIYKYFPNQPDERKTLDKLHVDFNGQSPDAPDGRYAHKVFGYILPPTQGKYLFKFVMGELTAAASVELWISPSSSPLNIQKRLVLEYDDMDRPTKRKATSLNKQSEVRLKNTVHYFEFLMKAFEGKAVVDLLWQLPDADTFVPISNEYLAMAQELNGDGQIVEGPVTKTLRGPLPSKRLQTHHRAYYVGNIIYTITNLDNVLPPCEFKAEYAWPHKVRPYKGVYQVLHSKIYPRDDTWFKNWEAKDKGNPVIEEETARSVFGMYTKAFNESKHDGKVLQLIHMEETVNKEHGSRFLLELVIEMKNPSEVINTSEYVYLPKGSDKLYRPSNFQWKNGVKVYLIVSVKNLGFWINHLMHNMEDIYAATRDDNFYLVVVDYASEDADVEELMGKSSFKNWHIIKKQGAFSRSAGLQAGIDSVKEPDSIVMTIDMHLTLPVGFVEAIRKHTIQGKMGYTPYFFRLNKGYTEVNYNGFWETLTYGLFGLFKSDWDAFGGFNLVKYKDKWGGEDWDILDRVLARGYEVFRIRVPGLVHYQHTKAGMWGGKKA